MIVHLKLDENADISPLLALFKVDNLFTQIGDVGTVVGQVLVRIPK